VAFYEFAHFVFFVLAIRGGELLSLAREVSRVTSAVMAFRWYASPSIAFNTSASDRFICNLPFYLLRVQDQNRSSRCSSP
jgi:hypothetical protein